MVVRRGCYKKEDLEEALDRAYEGEKFAAVTRTSSIPLRKPFKKAKELQTTGNIVERRRGPAPSLLPEQEADLVACVAGMQRAGFPVGPARVLQHANKIYERLCHATTRTGTPFQPLTKGWYERFISRYPVLTPRAAEKITRVRNMVDTDSVRTLFYAITKRVGSCAQGVVQRLEQGNEPNFHMAVVEAVNAAGAALPPLIIVPGKRIYKTDKAALSIEGDRITGAPKVFSNGGVFRLWLARFAAEAAKINAQFPVVLVLDNSSTHLELETVRTAYDMGILLLTLPPNSTHMCQPLDVAVFKSFKSAVKDTLTSKLLNTADMVLSKKDAIAIACSAYQTGIIDRPDNAVTGFKATGLFPRSLANMTKGWLSIATAVLKVQSGRKLGSSASKLMCKPRLGLKFLSCHPR
ncbi:hypothetical protein PI124_g13923 [Phytophthora idaei]|nr:hypothetical protein PI124_g13923 [Phytophthora idaei]